MKIGVCLLLLASENDPLAKECIPLVAHAGYDYAEVSLARIYNLSDEELAAYRKLFADNNLAIESFNNAVPAGFSVIGDDATAEVQDAYIQRSIKLAKQFDVSVITTSGPNARRVPEGFDWPGVGYARYIDFMKRFAAACAKENISIALEPICQEECGYVNTIDQTLAIINDVNMPNLYMLVDMFHSMLEKEDFSRLETYSKSGLLTHMHVADLTDRTVPRPKYTEALAELLAPLKKGGFDGRLSIEAKPSGDLASAIAEGITTVRNAWNA